MNDDARSMYAQLVAANLQRLRTEDLSLDALITRHNTVATQYPLSTIQLAEQDALLILIQECSRLPECPLGPQDMPLLQRAAEKGPRPIRRPHATAVAAAVVLLLTVVATAACYLLGTVELHIGNDTAEWTSSLETPGTLEMPTPDSNGYTSLSDALSQNGAGAGTPQWLPTRFSLESLDVYKSQVKRSFSAWYTAVGSDGLSIMVEQYPGGIPESAVSITEKDAGYESYTDPNGVPYYYYQNGNLWVGTWAAGDCITTISGDVSKDEMASILKSIHKKGVE